MSIGLSAPAFALGVVLSPMIGGIVSRVKSVLAGRRGAPVLQPYYDLARLLRKGAVYSNVSTPLTPLAPIVTTASALAALALMPLGSSDALISFSGDFLLFAYLLALGRLGTVLGALDSGSSFQGMGASREVTFSALVEPALLVALLAASWMTSETSLSRMLPVISEGGLRFGAPVALVGGAVAMVLLTENSRLPVDDPRTHLELTMIHEVMVLDYSGPDLGLVHYAADLKLWLMSALLVNIVIPPINGNWASLLGTVAGITLVAVLVGLVESATARLKLRRVPQFIVAAFVLAALGLMMGMAV